MWGRRDGVVELLGGGVEKEAVWWCYLEKVWCGVRDSSIDKRGKLTLLDSKSHLPPKKQGQATFVPTANPQSCTTYRHRPGQPRSLLD